MEIVIKPLETIQQLSAHSFSEGCKCSNTFHMQHSHQSSTKEAVQCGVLFISFKATGNHFLKGNIATYKGRQGT